MSKAEYARIVRNNGKEFADKWLREHRDRDRQAGAVKAVSRVLATDPVVALSGPAHQYALALASPRDGQGYYVPIPPVLRSRKIRTRIRGVIVTSQSQPPGLTYISFMPHQMAANDGKALVTCDNASTLTSLPDETFATSINFSSDSPYSLAELGGAAGGMRLVAAGMYVQYMGREENAGGLIIGATVGSGRNVGLAGMTGSELLATETGWESRFRPDDEYSIVWHPSTPADYEFQSWAEIDNPDGTSATVGPRIGAVLSNPNFGSTTQSVQTLVECYAHFEFIGFDGAVGYSTAAGSTHSREDSRGAQAVAAAIQNDASLRSGRTHKPGTDGGRFQDTLKQVSSTIRGATQLYSSMSAARAAISAAPKIARLAGRVTPLITAPELATEAGIGAAATEMAEVAPLLLL